MINSLLLVLAVQLSGFFLPSFDGLKEKLANFKVVLPSEIPSINPSLSEIEEMLHTQAPDLNEGVINKVLTALKCAAAYTEERNNILSVIDYSLPSNQKRLWVFNLREKKLLFHTYVSHGIKSGTLLTDTFSNKNNSKASSMGVYKTEKAYYGREGLSLRLEGLDKSFNDNAFNRSIVMHGGWYMDENFIKKYGRPGRSWGCPAVPLDLYKPIINTIKDKSLFVVYYPNDDWFGKSKYLNCDKMNTASNIVNRTTQTKPLLPDEALRDEVLFADINKDNFRAEEEPILVMAADSYERIFHTQVPLERMLRRQINHAEFVALSTNEVRKLVAQDNREGLNSVNFVVPTLHMVRGTYETQMKIVNLGKIKTILVNSVANSEESPHSTYVVNFEEKSGVKLKATNRFIRWLGL
ncbi:MAG: murein L,D-transpeptidase catalytic domain family protein [Legionella sp.]|nr:murein L,D-transpeptidase catalytic domain family protein [Legionella sp.]